MSDPETLSTLLRRLLDLAFPPSNDEGVRDLTLALEAAVNDDAMTAAVDEWVRYESNCPKPAQMRKLIWEQNQKYEPRPSRGMQLPSGNRCADCKGFGVRETTHAGDLNSVSSWCDCLAGAQARNNSCRCPENPNGRCSRPLSRDTCCAPPWAVNAARRRLLLIDGQATLRRIPVPASATVIDVDDYRGEF